jgi:hypothetical protein
MSELWLLSEALMRPIEPHLRLSQGIAPQTIDHGLDGRGAGAVDFVDWE